jgi:hypothetical protein
MNLSTRLMPRPSAESWGLFSAIAAGERAGRRPRFRLGTLMVLGIRKFGLTALITATLCSTTSRLVAADPSVEVFTQNGTVTSARDGDISLFPQLPFRWSGTIDLGYDDNVSTTAGGGGSAFTQTNLTVAKDLRTARTKLSIELGIGVVYYFHRINGRSTDPNGSLKASLQHNVSERLTLAASVDAAYLAEPQFATGLGPARRRGNYFTTSDSLKASYAWSPRLSSDTSYLLGLIQYEDHLANVGQDRIENTFGESFRFLWSPRTTLIAEYRFELIAYDGSLRNSSTHIALGGLDYQISPRLNATLRGGATLRKFENQGNGERLDPNASASLNYLIGPSSSVNWTVGYSIEEPDSAEALSRTTFRTGLELRYQLTGRLSANVTLNYHHDENAGLLASGLPGANLQEFTEDAFELVLGAKYTLTRRVALNFAITHTELDSERQLGGYSRNRYTAGLAINY